MSSYAIGHFIGYAVGIILLILVAVLLVKLFIRLVKPSRKKTSEYASHPQSENGDVPLKR
ncbi:hypothetical protein [Metabacillus sp. RGM 3146]|uniref:hypothetical protein n=1 Tax=Metabacillus sp. RGM 3146 TaxID=3401092 RepID=UPI003B9B3B8C